MPLKDHDARIAYQLAWYHKNKDKIRPKQKAYAASVKGRATTRAWVERNIERYREQHRKSKRKHQTKRVAQNREYRRCNVERVRAWGKAWREANPFKVLATKLRRRQRHSQCAGTCNKDQLAARFAYHGNRCIYCKKDGKLHADHLIPITRGGTNWPSNLAPACEICNKRKSTKTYQEFITLLRREVQ